MPIAESFDIDGPEYVADAWCCFACAAREAKAKAWRDDPASDSDGIKFIVRREEAGDE